MAKQTDNGKPRDDRMVSKNSPISVWQVGEEKTLFHMLCYDCSNGGIGCIYVGDEPPLPGNSLIWQNGKEEVVLQVRWMKTVGERIFRFGLQFV
ncbi:MAG: hypothetical protein HQL31_11020 [Planctomycetes bacterium]|nr:hypothetical protein [Planctomycetota bacterium]